MKVRLAYWMRRWADRLDHAGAPKAIGWSFTIEAHNGGKPRFRDDGKGCQLWYLGDADYERAHTEADTEHVRVDWAGMTSSYVGGGK